jgi:hypothetical protein
MSIQLDPQTTNVPFYLSNLLQKSNGNTLQKKTRSGIGDSSKVSGIEVRMLAPLIKENGKNPLIGGDYSKLYCLTIVVSDLPNQTVGGIDLKGFPRIGDNEALPINKTLFYWQGSKDNEQVPNQIHFVTRVINSRKALRDVGQILTEAKSDADYKGLVGSLGSLLKNATALNPISEGIFALSSIIGKYLGKVEDKDLGTVINSYTTLHGDFDTKGINRFNYPTKNVDFNFELVVRDASLKDKNVAKGVRTKTTTDMEEEEENVTVDLSPF